MLNVLIISSIYIQYYLSTSFLLAGIAAKYHINKYPTLKLIRYGVATKREFRGARSVESFTSYLNDQLADPVNKLNSLYHINEFDVSCQFC